MTIALYATAGILIALGVALTLPAVSDTAHPADLLIALSGPIASNGILLVLSGTILLALGKIIAALQLLAERLVDDSDTVDQVGRIIVRCPQCTQQLRIKSGKLGTISCPKCNATFEAKT
jgi:hypothetical protein